MSGAPVGVPGQFNRSNELAFRQFVEGEVAAAYRKDGNVILPFGYTLGFTGQNGEEVLFYLNGDGEFVLTVNGTEIFNISPEQATFALNNDGRVVGIRLSDGSTTTIDLIASTLRFYDGVTDRALIEAGGGLLTVNGDLGVSGSIKVGAVRWPVALQVKAFYKADGEAVQWAGGAALSAVPDVNIVVPAGVALAAGEAFEAPTIVGATTVGGTLRLKISTPGATSSVTDTTDSAGGGASPDRVMAKTDAADAYNFVYNFRAQGTINVVSESDGLGSFFHTGRVTLSTWFNDGGGWDEGPAFIVDVIDALGYEISGADMTGAQPYDVTRAISWGSAIGSHGGDEWGMSYASGGALTDFVSVQYIKQSAAGTRTGSPNGETATIYVLPRNI